MALSQVADAWAGNGWHSIDTTAAGPARHLRLMATGVRDLKVWQEAVALGGEVLRVVRHSARRETKTATDALILTALAVASHVAEGYGRYTAPEQRQLYRAAKRDLLRLETQLAILRHADLLSLAAHGDLVKRTHHVSRLLAGYIVYLERQRATEDDDVAPPKPVAAAASS
jgi:four helix bundle protein